jgi:hypothetical protein
MGLFIALSDLIKILKLGYRDMVNRKKIRLRNGDILDVEEYHDGNYGSPGKTRRKKEKPTKEQVRLINQRNKAKRCRWRLLQYFNEGDLFITWTYEVRNRPPNMDGALKDFRAAIGKIRKVYRGLVVQLYWIRNIERGTKGAWHIHLVIKQTPEGDAAAIVTKAWTKGGTYVAEIRHSKFTGDDMEQLADYLTKDEHTAEQRKDGIPGKPRIAESSYSTSRNMPLPEPKEDKLVRWKPEVKPPKGYYIARIHEGINPVTGFLYRSYTLIRLKTQERKKPPNRVRRC